MSSDETEIVRLRDRMHDVESKLVGIEWIVGDLREWRAESRTVLEKCRKDLDDVMNADTVAEQVAEKLRDGRVQRWSMTEKMIGAAVAVGTLATAVHGWIG